MFPIGIMYYFGTNLDEKFCTPNFWPKKEQTHTIPFERKEIDEEIERLRARRLAARARRLDVEGETSQIAVKQPASIPSSSDQGKDAKGWLSWLR